MVARVRSHRRLLAWLIALALLVWVLRTTSLQEAWEFLRRLDMAALAALVAANFLVLLTLSGRWWLILRAQGHRLPYLTLAGYRLGAFGISYFTPGPHFGGEPLQVYLVEKRHCLPRSTAIASVTLDKSLELMINFAFLAGGVGVILHLGLVSQAVGTRALAVALALLALPVLLLLAIALGYHPLSSLVASLARWTTGRPSDLGTSGWRSTLAALPGSLRESEDEVALFCRQHPTALVPVLAISLASWVAMIGEYWLATQLLGLDLSPVQALAALMAARLALLAALPAGLGTLEASQVLALGSLGINPAAGISLSILIRARDVLLAGAGLWWGLRQLRRARAVLVLPADL